MDFSSLTSADLKRLSKLIEKKESIQAQIALIKRELNGLKTIVPTVGVVRRRGTKSPVASGSKAVAKVQTQTKSAGRPSHVKDAIIGLLQNAGKTGLSVKEIAGELQAKNQNIYMWFSVTGKKLKNIKKVAPGHYAWTR